jgi:dTDP-4-amino-4,6-dideoxygalactose transaminase
MTKVKSTIPVMSPRLPETAALVPYLKEIDANRWYSNFGPLQRRFESRLADHFDLPKEGVVCVGNCTVGLMLALMAAAPERGGYCVMPSFTFVASAHAVLAAGLVPLFIDVDPRTWTVTPAGVSEAIRSAGRPVAAVLVVSSFGAPVDVAEWDVFAEASGVPVVIDAAAGFDGAVAGRSPVVISLHATKVMGAGEGGVVLSRDTGVIELIAASSNFGFRGGRDANAAGFNGKLSEYNAAVGLASLDAWPKARRMLSHLTRLYGDALSGIGNIAASPGFGAGWVSSTCNIAFDRPVADAAMRVLADAGIDSRQWWGKGCHRHRAFAEFPRQDLSVTDDLGRRVLGLPFHEALSEADISRIVGVAASAAQR